MPIFRVKSVKTYTGQEKFTPAKKNLHEYIRGVRDKYQVRIIQKAVGERLGKYNKAEFLEVGLNVKES